MALSPAASATLAKWHAMLGSRDLTPLAGLVAPHAVFRSPMRHTPYEGGMMVVVILNAVFTVFEDFQYARVFEAGSNDVVLEFSARVGDKQLKGIDMIKFDDEGKIVDFEVMIRPASALMALGEVMGRKLAAASSNGGQ